MLSPVSYGVRNLTEAGSNIISTTELVRGYQHVLQPMFSRQKGLEARFQTDDSTASVEALIAENTRAVFCESIGNPGGQRGGH